MLLKREKELLQIRLQEKIDYIDEYINSNVMSVSFLAGEVFKLYSNFLKKDKNLNI